MKDKFTFRDFIVYFFSGFVVLLYTSINWHVIVLNYLTLNNQLLKDLAVVMILLLSFIGYFIGHILHSLDTLLYFICTRLRNVNCENKLSMLLIKVILNLIGGHRVSMHLALKNGDEYSFWTDCAKLQMNSNYIYSEYWYVMNDLFKGLTLASMIFTIISIIQGYWVIVAVCLILSILFWLRSYYFALWFIRSVERAILVSDLNEVPDADNPTKK